MKCSTRFISLLSLSLTFTSACFADDSPLVQLSNQILNTVSDPAWNNDSCVKVLVDLQDRLDTIQVPTLSRDQVKSDAQILLNNLWHSRIALHDHLSIANNDCEKQIRNTTRQFRFIEDFVGEIFYAPGDTTPEQIKADFGTKKDPGGFQAQHTPIDYVDQAGAGYLFQKRDEKFELQAGDIVIARGVSYLSAMISRLGDNQSQFSHVILVTENPDKSITDPKLKIQTIESYVGEGIGIHEREWALRNENARLLVLRPKDQELGKKASQDMRELVASRTGKNKIYYDYSLDFTDHTAMSCAEVAQVAYLNASVDRKDPLPFILPERVSTLSHGLDLVTHLGVKPGNTFTPGDMEYDSRFEIIAEFRDLRLTRDSRLKDAIMSKMIQWMDESQYTLRDSSKSKLAEGLIWDIRHSFLWEPIRFIAHLDEFSREIPRPMVGTVTLISQLGDGMYQELKKRDLDHERLTGFPMTYLDLYHTLETMRVEDESLYVNKKTRKKSIILRYLRNDDQD